MPRRLRKGWYYYAGFDYVRVGPGPAAGGAGRGVSEPGGHRRRARKPRSSGDGGYAPRGRAGTRCGSARGERAGGAVFLLPAPGQESRGHRVKARCAQVSLPFALRRGSGPGPGR